MIQDPKFYYSLYKHRNAYTTFFENGGFNFYHVCDKPNNAIYHFIDNRIHILNLIPPINKSLLNFEEILNKL